MWMNLWPSVALTKQKLRPGDKSWVFEIIDKKAEADLVLSGRKYGILVSKIQTSVVLSPGTLEKNLKPIYPLVYVDVIVLLNLQGNTKCCRFCKTDSNEFWWQTHLYLLDIKMFRTCYPCAMCTLLKVELVLKKTKILSAMIWLSTPKLFCVEILMNRLFPVGDFIKY